MSLSYAQELTCSEWTMDQYNAKMAELQKREADAKAEIAATDQKLEQVAAETAELEKLTAAEWQALYEALGVSEDDISNFRNSLDAVDAKVDGLAALSPEDLFQRRKEIGALEEELKTLGENKVALLSEMQDKIAMVEGKISQLKASLPKADFDEYTVVKGDYLWKIAGKEDIYDDPYQWIRIYSYNRDQIKDADLIYADQIFKIQRSAADNEYIVVKGDWLAKIAGKAEVFNDPTKWTKLFEANNNVITDKDVIYPHQVLIIPE
jgi:nucleoid-associated protein YgaU